MTNLSPANNNESTNSCAERISTMLGWSVFSHQRRDLLTHSDGCVVGYFAVPSYCAWYSKSPKGQFKMKKKKKNLIKKQENKFRELSEVHTWMEQFSGFDCLSWRKPVEGGGGETPLCLDPERVGRVLNEQAMSLKNQRLCRRWSIKQEEPTKTHLWFWPKRTLLFRKQKSKVTPLVSFLCVKKCRIWRKKCAFWQRERERWDYFEAWK